MLEFETTEIPACVKKELTVEKTISAREHLKGEIGVDDEFDEIVPAGEEWDVVYNIRVEVRNV